MEHASLVAFLEGKLTPEQFALEVADEVRTCKEATRTTGEGRVKITPGPDTAITHDHARRLLQAVLDDRLRSEIANYTATCIIFGDFHFCDDVVNEAVWLLEMADIDQPTSSDLRAAVGRLTG